MNSRALHIGAAAVIATSVIGFLSGTREPGAPLASEQPAEARSGDPAPSYGELRDMRRGPNAGMYEGAFDALRAAQPRPSDPVIQTAEQKREVIAARAERRAYDGAPPTIPHDITQRGFPDCLACHEKGARIAGKRAPVMSHPRYDSCPQCHVPANAPSPLPPRENATPNVFVGVESPGAGARAWPGAPPTIPHSTQMRSECSSCHGVGGANGIRTTHPYRQSCTQCHAPNAARDQRIASDSPPPRGLP
jgi:cytochrome c-type protein NapB